MSINKLLEDNHISFYWMGFILADGYINKNNRLIVELSPLDLKHLEKLGSFLNVKVNKNRLGIQDKEIVSKIMEKFNIKPPKTYNPPNIIIFEKFDIDLILSLIIGFIDGDGCIKNQTNRTDCSLRIKNHSSWLSVLQYFSRIIINKSKINFPEPKINNSGYSELSCCNMNILKFLKNYSIKYNLPVLQRKWDKIDLNRISMYDIANDRRKKVQKLRNQGLTYKEITDIVGITKGRISIILNEHRNN